MGSKEAALYRQKAAEMRNQAERALSDHLRATYFTIADDWERMAAEAEQPEGPPPPPKQADGPSAKL